ncbi:MAG: hypothetical protein NTY35_15310 [Planctomycetota bacterium]|nr:hypothetical protein [Planctomycetota bacterium]
MSRVLDVDRCPHCRGELARPTPRVCPHCAGSIQQRYVTSGCLTSAPKLLLVGVALWGALELVRNVADAFAPR